MESRHERRRHPPGLPRVHGRNRPCGHPARAADPPRRPDHAVHRQRDAAAAAVPARRRPPGRDAASPTARPACASRTSRRSATTGIRPSSRCSATGASATTSSSEQLHAGLDLPHRDGRARPEPDLRLLLHRRRGPRHPEGHRVGRASGPSCSPRPASRADQVELGTEEHGAEVGHRRRADRLLRQEELVVPRRQRRERCRSASRAAPTPRSSTSTPQIEHDPAYGANCHQNCDCGRFIELGNSVFMEYQTTETGFEPLPRKNVDYGGGLARIAAASIDSPDVFRINLLWPIIEQAAGAVRQDLRGRDASPCGSSPTTCAARPSWPSTASGRATRRRATSCAGWSAGRSGTRSTSGSRRTSSRRSSRRSPASTPTHYPEVGERGGRRSSPCWSRRSRPSGGPCARASSSCAATGRRASPAPNCSSSTTPTASRSS